MNNKNASSTLYVILKWNANALQKTPCEINQQENHLHANCANRSIVDVPQSLSKNIQSLDLSHNKLKNLDNKAFEKYANLVRLTLNKMQKFDEAEDAVKSDAFRNLEKLEFLDISDSLHNEKDIQEWPPNLKVLLINNNGIRHLKLRNLRLLERIEANNNELRDFPQFNAQAPLTVIQIEHNPLDTILVMDVAPFCQLQDIRMKFEKNLFLQNEKHYCDCRRLEHWFKTHKIKSTPLNCTMPHALEESCDLEFSEPELRSRRECLARIGKETTNPMMIISLMVAALIVLLLLGIYIFILKRKKFRRRGGDADHDDDDDDHGDDYDE